MQKANAPGVGAVNKRFIPAEYSKSNARGNWVDITEISTKRSRNIQSPRNKSWAVLAFLLLFGRALLTETKVESGDVSKEKLNLG